MDKKGVDYIDCTPTWEGLLPGMLGVLESTTASDESKQLIRDEILRMARAVDKANAAAKNDK